jgi:hypothetical protein
MLVFRNAGARDRWSPRQALNSLFSNPAAKARRAAAKLLLSGKAVVREGELLGVRRGARTQEATVWPVSIQQEFGDHAVSPFRTSRR